MKDSSKKKLLALSFIPNALTVKAICNKANVKYQSLLESGLCIATDLKKDIEAVSSTFLLEKLSSKVNKLSGNITKCKGTGWACREEGHKLPDCPKKNGNSPASSKEEEDNDCKKKVIQQNCNLNGRRQSLKAPRVSKSFETKEHGSGATLANIGAHIIVL